jgi:hypothetical protein
MKTPLPPTPRNRGAQKAVHPTRVDEERAMAGPNVDTPAPLLEFVPACYVASTLRQVGSGQGEHG